MSSPQTIRIVAFLQKRPDLSEEQFYNYWEKIHAPLVAPWALKYGVVAYSQIHSPRSARSTAIAGNVPDIPDAFEYDGVAQMDILDMPTFARGFQDPYYVNVISVDENRFLDKTSSLMRVVGMGKQILDSGKAVVDLGDNLRIWKEWEEKENEKKMD